MPDFKYDSEQRESSRTGLPLAGKWRRWLRGDLAELPLAEQLPYLEEWFNGLCGQELLRVEQEVLDHTLQACFGYHLLSMTVSPQQTLTRSSPIHHQVLVTPLANVSQSRAQQTGEARTCTDTCIAELAALPIESESVDVVLLHHTLEFSPNPHQVLKEVNRVLVHRGHVVIVAFNTFSLFGVCKRLAALFSRSRHWQHSGLSLFRLSDWFKLLDLETTSVEQVFYRPPFSNAGLLKRTAFFDRIGRWLRLPFGGVQIIVARKDVCGVTPIKSPWQKQGQQKGQRRFVKIPGIQPAPKQTGQIKQHREVDVDVELGKRVLH